MKDKFAFLAAPRFWASVVGAFAIMMGPDGVITLPEVYAGLLALSAAFITVGTIDRNFDVMAEAKTPVVEINNQPTEI